MFIFNQKKRFFQKKINDVTRSLWELEFKISKARQMREQSRQLRDMTIEVLNRSEAALKGQPDNAQLQKQVTDAQTQIKGYEAQMKLVDDQVNGDQESDEKGLMEYMAGLAELKMLYLDYVTKI